MSAIATRERAWVAVERPQRDAGARLFDDRSTLEDRILGAWEDLIVEGRVACPVCGGSMAAGHAAAGAVAACSGCGSELS